MTEHTARIPHSCLPPRQEPSRRSAPRTAARLLAGGLLSGGIASTALAMPGQFAATATLVAAHLAAVEQPATTSGDPTNQPGGNGAGGSSGTPQQEGQSVDDIIRSLRRDDPAAPVVQPIDPEVINRPPGFGDLIAEVDRPLLPEGSRIVGVPGRLVRSDGGTEWMFEFEAPEDTDEVPLAPMPVIPCAELERRERLAEDPQFNVRFLVYGEVFVYRNRNYLLPSFIQPAEVGYVSNDADLAAEFEEAAGGTGADATASNDAVNSAPERGRTGGLSPRLRSRSMASSRTPQMMPSDGEGGGEDAVIMEALPEGTFLALRSGRLLRSSVGGEIIFVFDADKDGGQDPPVVLAPSLLLERMEKRAEDRTDGVRFLLSGEVLTYHNRNYLIPAMMVVPYERTNLSY